MRPVDSSDTTPRSPTQTQQTGQQAQQARQQQQEQKPPPLAGENAMNVVFVGAECAPWSKTGGLTVGVAAEGSAALQGAIARLAGTKGSQRVAHALRRTEASGLDIHASKQDLRPVPARLLTGGLGDVMGALPKAMARRGHRVMCIAPRYANYAEGWDTSVRIQMNVSGSNTEVGFAATSPGYCT